MQPTKAKAEVLGRKAKVFPHSPHPIVAVTDLTGPLLSSLPIPTKNSLSKSNTMPFLAVRRGTLSADHGSRSRSEFSNKDLKSVGNYTLGRLIGKGSFGKVYLANHKLTNGSKVSLDG